MAAPENNPIRDEPVKPPMLNPVVRHVLPSGDLKWILVAVVLTAAVGLLATDGCLSGDRRHIILTSRDRELVEEHPERVKELKTRLAA